MSPPFRPTSRPHAQYYCPRRAHRRKAPLTIVFLNALSEPAMPSGPMHLAADRTDVVPAINGNRAGGCSTIFRNWDMVTTRSKALRSGVPVRAEWRA